LADEKIFSEQEVADIIRRAVELTEEDAQKAYVPGVTYEELRKIAGEVGVDARALSRAIDEARGKKGGKSPFKFVEEFERVVEGEFDPASFDELLDGVTPFASKGESGITQVGRSLKVSTWNGVGQSKVDVVSRNGRTKVKVRSNSLFQALYTLYPAIVGSAIAGVGLGEQGLGLLGAAIAAGLSTIGVLLFGKLARVGHERARRQADAISDKVAEGIAASEQAKRLGQPAPTSSQEQNVEQRQQT
jgi:hypothetical protein